MTETTETTQKFMIKLPPKLHRELMAYAGVKGEAMSDILVRWVSSVWAQQPEHEALSKMVTEQATAKAKAAPKAAAKKATAKKSATKAKK